MCFKLLYELEIIFKKSFTINYMTCKNNFHECQRFFSTQNVLYFLMRSSEMTAFKFTIINNIMIITVQLYYIYILGRGCGCGKRNETSAHRGVVSVPRPSFFSVLFYAGATVNFWSGGFYSRIIVRDGKKTFSPIIHTEVG